MKQLQNFLYKLGYGLGKSLVYFPHVVMKSLKNIGKNPHRRSI